MSIIIIYKTLKGECVSIVKFENIFNRPYPLIESRIHANLYRKTEEDNLSKYSVDPLLCFKDPHSYRLTARPDRTSRGVLIHDPIEEIIGATEERKPVFAQLIHESNYFEITCYKCDLWFSLFVCSVCNKVISFEDYDAFNSKEDVINFRHYNCLKYNDNRSTICMFCRGSMESYFIKYFENTSGYQSWHNGCDRLYYVKHKKFKDKIY